MGTARWETANWTVTILRYALSDDKILECISEGMILIIHDKRLTSLVDAMLTVCQYLQ